MKIVENIYFFRHRMRGHFISNINQKICKGVLKSDAQTVPIKLKFVFIQIKHTQAANERRFFFFCYRNRNNFGRCKHVPDTQNILYATMRSLWSRNLQWVPIICALAIHKTHRWNWLNGVCVVDAYVEFNFFSFQMALINRTHLAI